MAYVVEHSNRTLPPFFKFSALWSGQEGSLLFWSFLLSIYVFSALLRLSRKTSGVDALRRRGAGRRADFLPDHE